MSRPRVNPISLLWIAACCTWSAAASAQPANDAIANAEVITTLPFSDAETAIHLATTNLADPVGPCRVPRTQAAQSVWYRYTTGASVEQFDVSTATSDYHTMLAIHVRPTSDLRPIASGCNAPGVAGSSTLAQRGTVRLALSTTYHPEVVQTGTCATPQSLNLRVSAAPKYRVAKVFVTADGN